MLESARDVTDHPRELAVDGVLRAAGRSGMVRFVEDEQGPRTEFRQEIPQARRVGFVGEQTVRDDEPRPRRPRIHCEALQAAHQGEAVAVDDREGETELRFQFILPLDGHRGWGCDHHEIDSPAQQQFPDDETGFHGLPQTDIVGDEQIDPRKIERLPEGQELVGVESDAGPERRLEQLPVGGRGSPPLQCPQVGGQDFRIIGSVACNLRPGVLVEEARADFGFPDDLQCFPLGVVGNPGQPDGGEFTAVVGGAFDQPGAASRQDEGARLRLNRLHGNPRWGDDTACRRAGIGRCGAERMDGRDDPTVPVADVPVNSFREWPRPIDIGDLSEGAFHYVGHPRSPCGHHSSRPARMRRAACE